MVDTSQAPSCTCRQRISGPEEKIFPGILNQNLNNFHYHFDDDQSPIYAIVQSC